MILLKRIFSACAIYLAGDYIINSLLSLAGDFLRTHVAILVKGTYWQTLVKEGVPRWGLVDAIADFFEPFVIPDPNCPKEKLNDAAITEIMSDLNKKSVAEQVEGVGAWKSRQKVNTMYLARTIKVSFMVFL